MSWLDDLLGLGQQDTVPDQSGLLGKALYMGPVGTERVGGDTQLTMPSADVSPVVGTLGGNPVTAATQADALRMASNMLQFGPADVGAIRAFHGSPNVFDKFDLSRAMSGNYGNAAYFHTAEPDAMRYRPEGGSTYEADILPQKPFYMDQPVSAEDAEAILRAHGNDALADNIKETGRGYRSGSELWYWGLGQGATQEAKADALRKAGFDAVIGDPGKEVAGKSTRSPEVAVYSPSIIDVLRRYGIAGLLGGAAATGASQQTSNQ